MTILQTLQRALRIVEKIEREGWIVTMLRARFKAEYLLFLP